MTNINDLNTIDALTDNDKLVVWNGSTRAITAADAADYFSGSGNVNLGQLLTSIQSLSPTIADQLIYTTGSDFVSVTPITPFSRSLLSSVSAATALTALNGQPLDATLTAVAGLTVGAGDYIEATGVDTFRARKLTVATYAALTVIAAASRFDDMLVYVSSRATDGDGGEGYWRFDAASSATANGGTILAPDAGSGRWFRQWDENNAQAAWWGAIASLAVDQSANIQAGIDWLEDRDRGGILLLPSGAIRIENTLTVERNNITLLGHGGDQPHDAGAGVRPGTILAWYGASGGGSTMVFFRTPSGIGNARRYGGGFKGVQMQCRTLADYGLRIESWGYAQWYNLDVQSPRVSAYWLTCLVTGTTIAEAGDNQRNDFWACSWRCIDDAVTKLANGFVLDGSSNANTSINIFRSCVGQHWDGTAWLMFNCDNNLLTQCGAFRAGGSGYTFRFKGQSPTTHIGGTANTLLNCGWASTNGAYIEGTEVSGNTSGPTPPNTFLVVDNSNGAGQPTYGTGTVKGIITFDNTSMSGMRQFNAPFGESDAASITARTEITASESVRVYNASQAHLALSDGTNVWILRVTGTTLDILRLAGATKLNLPGITDLQINGQDLSFGADDSGGVGFKLLRVPN